MRFYVYQNFFLKRIKGEIPTKYISVDIKTKEFIINQKYILALFIPFSPVILIAGYPVFDFLSYLNRSIASASSISTSTFFLLSSFHRLKGDLFPESSLLPVTLANSDLPLN